jgi:DNA (cytosine-5)-methyltransferase 1
MKQLYLGIANELIVDNFAGGGGASLGIEMAVRRSVDIAVNHDREAVAMHKANHPQTRHYCEDVWDVNPMEATGGRPVGLAWFSPDCTYHSKARGGKPFRDRKKALRRRGLAWLVVRWAKAVRPRVIMLENVEEFQEWGPLREDNTPCPLRKGMTFRRWKKQLENLGYKVECDELRACDYGAPTIRKRLFVIARRDGLPIVWPKPTHYNPENKKLRLSKGKIYNEDGVVMRPWRTAAECIDWSLPCPSIFERTRPLAEATMRRIAKGVKRYVIDAKEPFIVTCNHGGDGFRGQGINEPMKTITAARDAHGLVMPFLTEHANASHQRNFSADEPMRTQCAQVKGGHFALVAAFMAQHNTGMVGHPANKPVSTITGRGTQQQLVTSHLTKLYGTCNDGQDNRAPMPTITSGGQHIGEVRAFLIKYYGTDQDPQLREPMHTVTTKQRFGIVTVKGEDYVIADVGMRMLQPRELYRAQGFPDSYIIDPQIDGKPLTKTAQVRMCGNSVSPVIAKALVEANLMQQTNDVAVAV